MDLSTPAAILAFLQGQGYLIMFLLMLLEGPVIAYVAGFAASLGLFSIFIVLLFAIAGNIVPDAAYFFIGRFAGAAFSDRHVRKAIGKRRMDRLRRFLCRNPGKALTMIKLVPPLTIPGLILSGASGLSFFRFFLYSFMISIPYSAFFVFLGYYSGVAFGVVVTYVRWLPLLIALAVALIAGAWFLVRTIFRRLSERFGWI